MKSKTSYITVIFQKVSEFNLTFQILVLYYVVDSNNNQNKKVNELCKSHFTLQPKWTTKPVGECRFFDEDSMMCAARFDCFLEAYPDSESCEDFEEIETSNKDK